MLVKLDVEKETEKAYLLKGTKHSFWIPKSVLDMRGLEYPFCQIKDWYYKRLVEEMLQDKDPNSLSSISLFVLNDLECKHRDLPKEIQNKWKKFWSSCDSGYYGDPYENPGSDFGMGPSDFGVPNC